jgi:hypothetical protein
MFSFLIKFFINAWITGYILRVHKALVLMESLTRHFKPFDEYLV